MSAASNGQKKANGSSARDKGGRFLAGASGNPNGRPRKRPPPPWSLGASAAAALAELVRVVGANGASLRLPMGDFLVKKMVTGILVEKPKTQLQMLQLLEKLISEYRATEPDEEEYEKIFSEENRRLLEIIEREFCPDLESWTANSNFNKPGTTKGSFGLD